MRTFLGAGFFMRNFLNANDRVNLAYYIGILRPKLGSGILEINPLTYQIGPQAGIFNSSYLFAAC